MPDQLNVLILDDNPADAELLVDALQQAGYVLTWVRVDTESAYLDHLKPSVEMILADYSMPQFSVSRALDIMNEQGLDIPLIVVTGSVTEQILEETLQRGAVDYLIKDRLSRLGGAVSRALKAKDLRAENQRNQAALRESEERYRLIVETALEGIWMVGPDRKTGFVNSKMAEMLGYSVEEMRDQPAAAYFIENEVIVMRRQAQESVAGKFDLQLRRKDGSTMWGMVSITPVRTPDGAYGGVFAMITDITERKRTEEAEREQRLLAEALREIATTLASTLDPGVVMARILETIGHVIPHDYASITLLEHDQTYVAYWRGYDPTPPAFLEGLRIPLDSLVSLREMARTRKPFVISDTTISPLWTRLTDTEIGSYIGSPIQVYGSVLGFLNILSRTPGFFTENYVERLQAFAGQAALALQNAQLYAALRDHVANLEDHVQVRTSELRQVKERVEAILNNSSDGIVVMGSDGLVVETNPAFEELFAFHNVPGANAALIDFADTAHDQALTDTLRDVLKTQHPRRIEISARSKDGKTFDADVAMSPIMDNGRSKGVVCSFRDISDLKRIEADLRKLLVAERELGELKSRFISMASHEFRTPLATILLTSQTLWQYWDKIAPEERRKRFTRIEAQIHHMTELLEDVLTIGRSDSGTLDFVPELMDLGKLCRDIVEEFRQSVSEQRLVFSTSQERFIIQGDVMLLRQAIVNLLTNAIKYSAPDTPIRLMLAMEAHHVRLTVQDEGIGIPEPDQKYVFHPFHRSSNVGSVAGTGLGLAIVKRAIDLHGGEIAFESELGIGSTFTIVLPAVL